MIPLAAGNPNPAVVFVTFVAAELSADSVTAADADFVNVGEAAAEPPAFATSWNFANVFSAVGLMAKTIPAVQWGPWAQYHPIPSH